MVAQGGRVGVDPEVLGAPDRRAQRLRDQRVAPDLDRALVLVEGQGLN